MLGATLQQLLNNESFIPLQVPFWIKYACKAMLVKDTFLDRLWLDAGMVDDIPKLLAALEDPESFNVRPFSALTIGRVLVLFFKKLPAPLLTLELHDHLRGAAQLEVFEDETTRIRFLADLLRTLPVPNYFTLRKLLRVFAKVWNEQNRETQRSTLEIWAPILVLRENAHDMSIDLPWACHLLRIMIENNEKIFPKKKLRTLDPMIASPRNVDPSERIGKSIKANSSFSNSIAGGSSSLMDPSAIANSGDPYSSDTRLSLSWLSSMNAEKVKTIEVYLAKMNGLLKEFQECMKESCEMMHCLELCVQKMTCMVDSLSMNPKALTRLIDTYHLDRCHAFVVDLHIAIKKSRREDPHQSSSASTSSANNSTTMNSAVGTTSSERFSRFFDTRALHGTLQRLYLSLEHELSLAFEGVDTLMGGAIKNDPRNQSKFKKHTIQLLKQKEAAEFWASHFGAQSFSVSWEHFSKKLLNATANLSTLYTSTAQKTVVLARLRNVLDDAQTNFITVYKFAKFLDGFGDLHLAVHRCSSIVSQPWFHGYVSKREATRLLEPFEPSTFLIRFASLDPASFAVNFKDESHQLYSINVDVIHRPNPEGISTAAQPPLPNIGSTTNSSSGGSYSQIINLPSGSNSPKPTLAGARVDPEPSKPRVDTIPIYVVMEGSESREFRSLDEMIENYADFLKKTVMYKMLIQPWFYGEFTAQECQAYLQHEAVGTFLVRFSSHHAKLTLDYVSEDGTVIQHRLERTVDGKVANGNLLFEDIDHFVSETKGLRYAYKHDNQVSTTQEEESSRRSNVNFISLLQDPEPFLSDSLLEQLMTTQPKTDVPSSTTPRAQNHHSAISDSNDPDSLLLDIKTVLNGQPSTYLQMNQPSIISVISQKLMLESMPVLPLPSSNPGSIPSSQYASNYIGPLNQDNRSSKRDVLESQLSNLLTKVSSRASVTFREIATLNSLAFSFDAATYMSVQTRIHKDLTGSSLLRKKGCMIAPQFLTLPKTVLHKLSQVEFKIKNRNKTEMKYLIEGPTAITTNFFFALSSSSGFLKGGESVKITVSVVLFKPCVIHDMIYVHLDEPSSVANSSSSALGSVISAAALTTANHNSQTFAIPVSAAMDKSCMWQEVERFWTIPEDFLASIRAGSFIKKLGAGAAATVYLATLYGVNVAVKVWDIGTRNMPPADFDQELSIMAAIHHPNLVRFIGAIPGRGQGALVMEFVSGGSLDKYLKFKQPDDEDMARAESESRLSYGSATGGGVGGGSGPNVISTGTSHFGTTDQIVIRNLNLSGDPNVSIIHSQSGTTQTYRVQPDTNLTTSTASSATATGLLADSSKRGLRGAVGSGSTSSSMLTTEVGSVNLSALGIGAPSGSGRGHLRQVSTDSGSGSAGSSSSGAQTSASGGFSLTLPNLNGNVATPLSGASNFLNRVPIALDIAKALLYLHERNLIHRDVKTLNVLINRESLSTRLSDFGEAATRDATLNEMVGSTPWMAPEVSLSEVYSSKADVFSFGLVLYELLVESYPVRTMHMIAEGMVPRIPMHFCLAYPAYVRLIHACTLQNPDKRPTMFSVVRELEKIQAVNQGRRIRAIR